MLHAMAEISDKSDEIRKIVKTIEDFSFQTNILSLNAAVEAARAGDRGKGFSVVANEVRSLASQSSAASRNTAALIQSSLQAVENGRKIANETSEAVSYTHLDVYKRQSSGSSLSVPFGRVPSRE